jgi:LysM repeat protein
MIKIKNIFFKTTLSLLLCLFSVIINAQTKSTDVKTIGGKKYYIHKVEKGQSLYAISKIYGIDVNSVLAENDDAIDGLKNGQELKIPFQSLLPKQAVAIDTNKYIYHKVVKGETVYSITKKYKIDEKKFVSYNPTINSGLKEGDYVIIAEKKKSNNVVIHIAPSSNSTVAVASESYTVQQGETLYGISKKLNVSQEDLLKWNPAVKEGISTGQVLKINSGKVISQASIVTSTAIIPTSIVASSTIIPMSTELAVISKAKKASYNIGLILPFKLVESESINIDELARLKASFPQTQSLALDFYFGFKKAVDSLVSKDFEVNIHLFDIDERDSAKVEAICKSGEFKLLDAVFGPLNAGVFKLVSGHTKNLGIPIISPVIQQNKILFNNPLVSKVNPSQYTLIEGLADYCIDSLLASSNSIIVSATKKDQSYVNAFKSRYNSYLLTHGKSVKDSITEVKGISGVKNAYVSGKKNVIILLTNNQVFLQDFITQLYAFSDKKDIALVGFNNVSAIDNLDQDYLNALQFHFATSNYVDFHDSTIRQLTYQYQEVYTADPSDYFFQGFDIAMYYLSNLKNQGPDFFLNLEKYPKDGVSTRFKFVRPDNETGFENRAVYIFKYSNYKLRKLGWK